MRTRWIAWMALLLSALPLTAWDLPQGARVLEERPVPSRAHSNRGLVLWMQEPERHPRDMDPDDPYTCPEETRGSYWSGPAFVSLVDLKAKKILATLALDGGEWDAFDLPYQIHAGSYYLVEHPGKDKEGRPTLLNLRDVNGDGRAQEFVLYEADACMGLGTTLIGYSEKQDRVIQYPVVLTTETDKSSETGTRLWADYLFSEKPVAPGHWRYSIDYSGRGGCVDAYDVRYDPETESFKGTFRQSECADEP
jgi:hypothetical protein